MRQDEVVDESGAEREQHQVGDRSAPTYFTFIPRRAGVGRDQEDVATTGAGGEDHAL